VVFTGGKRPGKHRPLICCRKTDLMWWVGSVFYLAGGLASFFPLCLLWSCKAPLGFASFPSWTLVPSPPVFQFI
jgi:hypothetical protein